MTTTLSRQALPVERFVELFVAALVQNGWRRITLKDAQVRAGFEAVVNIMDDIIAGLMQSDASWDVVWPWVQTANRLRISSTGGLENWEHQLRAAQRKFTSVPNPEYDSVDFSIDPLVAKRELESISLEHQKLVDSAVQAFNASFQPTTREGRVLGQRRRRA
jgi:hypothetical protein